VLRGDFLNLKEWTGKLMTDRKKLGATKKLKHLKNPGTTKN